MRPLPETADLASAGTASRPTRVARADLSCLAGLLLALGVGLVLAAVARRCGDLFGPLRGWRIAASAGLCCLALGALAPQRAAEYLGRRQRGDGPIGLGRGDDLRLLWSLQGLVCLLAGVALAVVPFTLSLLEWVYVWLRGEFLWSSRPRFALEWGLTAMVLFPALSLPGLALSCTCRLAGDRQRWRVGPMGWALVGVGLGLGISVLLDRRGWGGSASAPLAAVPVLLVSVISAQSLGSRSHRARDGHEAHPLPLVPERRDRWPVLMRGSAAWLAAASAALPVIWLNAVGHWSWPGGAAGGLVLMLVPSAIGLGLLLGERSKSSAAPSVAGLGLACAAAGLVLAAAMAAPAAWQVCGWSARIPTGVLVAAGCVAGLAIGYALAYAHLAVLCRVGSRSVGGVGLLALSLATASAVLLLVGSEPASGKSTYATAAAIALSLLGLGGIHIIHEPDYAPHTRRQRLVAVFTAVVVLGSV
ncbi:MAG: hypothetical protein IID40_09985 [Planctomycetes bacterium]|nr:hypothetical protein [Planctomycetota bacterium]